MPRICISLCYTWQITLGQERIKSGSINDISQLKGFGKAVWNFISSIYESSWNIINTDNNNYSFRNKVTNEFTFKVPKIKILSNFRSSKDKAVEIIKLPPPIPAHPSKEVLKKSKFFSKEKEPMTMNKAPQKKSYAQVIGPSVSEILKLRENYPNLLTKKIENIQKIINNSGKSKPYIKMTTRGPSHKQIIVLMNKENTNKFMASFSSYMCYHSH